ncbi:Cocaine esterase [Ralstonia condita]|uniref:Cocaine esterase n=1 Tax=Ralstonia condita TaxID=3058600 RepID=A0ABM9J0P9_9RALS|nr:CocE/NonD family hydrolase [Ralstonia sp. LMG 7141]CAJ0778622.1 Cocaine esterase [Ralstonia sp. LMG 7141]
MQMGTLRARPVRRLILPLLCAALALSGCGGDGASSVATQNTAPADSNATSTSAVPGAANWTTLGTRATLAQPGTSITSNAGARWVDYNPPMQYAGVARQPTQYVTMPDGTKLAAYVTLPADAAGNPAAGPFPTVLVQTSYNGGNAQYEASIGAALGAADPYIVQHGYATVVVDVRGTGQSQGSWDAFGADEQSDYGHVVDWVMQQPWSNGAIGLYGVSYLGITTVITAAQNHPAVKAAFPIVPIGDGYRDIVFTGGQTNLTFIPAWFGLVSVLSLTDPTLVTDPAIGLPTVLQHLVSAVTTFQLPTMLQALVGTTATAYDGAFWATRSPLETDGKIQVPTFVVGGLHDLFQRSEPLTYETIKTQAPAKLLIGPWTHLQAAIGSGLPADDVPPLNHIELQWFDQYVKGMAAGADALPNVTQYMTGYGHYATATDWPHPQVQALPLFLRGDRSLSATAPAADEAFNLVPQVPLNGACSISLSQWTAGLTGFIPLPCQTDDTLAEAADVKFETPPMQTDMVINGPIEADVWISTTALDAGVSVRIDDVDAAGNVTPLTDGLQTASLRAVDASRSRTMNGLMIQPWHPFTPSSAQPLMPGQPVLVPVEVFPSSALIASGHKLRVAVGASNLPQGVPPLPTLLNSLAGVLTIYSDAAHPSKVVLPVVPASVLQ